MDADTVLRSAAAGRFAQLGGLAVRIGQRDTLAFAGGAHPLEGTLGR